MSKKPLFLQKALGFNGLNCMSLAVWLGEDRCSKFTFGARVIYGQEPIMVRRRSLIGLLNAVSSLLCTVNYSGYIESCRCI